MGEKAWSVISELVDDIVSVDDEEILVAVHLVLTRTKLVVEPTGVHIDFGAGQQWQSSLVGTSTRRCRRRGKARFPC